LTFIGRTASGSYADQEDRHGSSREEGEFGVVSTTQRPGDAETDKRKNETHFST